LFKPKDNSGWNIGANDNGNFTIFDVVASTNSVVVETGAGANTLVIDSNSRLGIGTASPSVSLDINANDGISVGSTTAFKGLIKSNQTPTVTAGGSTIASMLLTTSGTSSGSGHVGIEIPSNDADDGFYIATDSNNDGTVDTLALKVKANGNVGIGTTSPSEPLHVNEGTGGVSTTLLLQNSSASVDGRGTNLTFKSSSTEIGQIQSKTVSDATSGILAFKTASSGTLSERMRINSDGDILFGVTSLSTTGAYFESASNSRMVLSLGTSTTSSSTLAAFKNSNGTVGSIAVSGSSTAFNTSSDARLKEVTGSARGLEVINELNPVAYNWKVDGKSDEGLIAQEVLDVVPNAVSGSEEDMYQMDYSKLVTHLVKAVQEQQEQIESLTSEIANLKEN